jgi:hypothetical protein
MWSRFFSLIKLPTPLCEAQGLRTGTPSLAANEGEAETTRHNSPILIVDELEYEPFTGNHRSPAAFAK